MLKDNLKLGILYGIIGPLIALICFYFWKFSVYPFKEFIHFLFLERKMLVGGITFSLIANALTFTLFINTNKDYTAKGIFIVTMIWGVVILGLKFL
jgi:hypothetical protein